LASRASGPRINLPPLDTCLLLDNQTLDSGVDQPPGPLGNRYGEGAGISQTRWTDGEAVCYAILSTGYKDCLTARCFLLISSTTLALSPNKSLLPTTLHYHISYNVSTYFQASYPFGSRQPRRRPGSANPP
jgi:hypothetical protein